MKIDDMQIGMKVKLRAQIEHDERNKRGGPGFNVGMIKYLGTVVTIEEIKYTQTWIVAKTWSWCVDWIECIVEPLPESLSINIHNIHYMEN